MKNGAWGLPTTIRLSLFIAQVSPAAGAGLIDVRPVAAEQIVVADATS
jgi:hypothetical protein